MKIAINLLIFVAFAIYMEWVAWFTHKYVMHGFLWSLHEDHHRPTDRGWQKNDWFAVFFASISILVIVAGAVRWVMPVVSAGFGIALYGLGYFLFHDIMFHRRIPGVRISVPQTAVLTTGVFDAFMENHKVCKPNLRNQRIIFYLFRIKTYCS